MTTTPPEIVSFTVKELDRFQTLDQLFEEINRRQMATAYGPSPICTWVDVANVSDEADSPVIVKAKDNP